MRSSTAADVRTAANGAVEWWWLWVRGVSNERKKGIGDGVLNLNQNERKKEKGVRRGEGGQGF